MYCVKCKKHTETINIQPFTARNGRLVQRGICSVCGKTKTTFGSGLFNKAVNNLAFEMHLPGHNFTGPGTQLDKRLNPDLTPKNGVNQLTELTQLPITTIYVMQNIKIGKREMNSAIKKCFKS